MIRGHTRIYNSSDKGRTALSNVIDVIHPATEWRAVGIYNVPFIRGSP
jgi:hypothetical protein